MRTRIAEQPLVHVARRTSSIMAHRNRGGSESASNNAALISHSGAGLESDDGLHSAGELHSADELHSGDELQPGAGLRPGVGPLRTSLPEASPPTDAFPIWFAALTASSCMARAEGENHAIRWACVSGRAVYTNRGGDAERIEPLGVSLMGGQTLAVYWMPGETAYTLEVYQQNEKCA